MRKLFMSPDDFRELILYFAHARDRYNHEGDPAAAQACEDAIALAHRIETELRIPDHLRQPKPAPPSEA